MGILEEVFEKAVTHHRNVENEKKRWHEIAQNEDVVIDSSRLQSLRQKVIPIQQKRKETENCVHVLKQQRDTAFYGRDDIAWLRLKKELRQKEMELENTKDCEHKIMIEINRIESDIKFQPIQQWVKAMAPYRLNELEDESIGCYQTMNQIQHIQKGGDSGPLVTIDTIDLTQEEEEESEDDEW